MGLTNSPEVLECMARVIPAATAGVRRSFSRHSEVTLTTFPKGKSSHQAACSLTGLNSAQPGRALASPMTDTPRPPLVPPSSQQESPLPYPVFTPRVAPTGSVSDVSPRHSPSPPRLSIVQRRVVRHTLSQPRSTAGCWIQGDSRWPQVT